jgi:hypothetical protein
MTLSELELLQAELILEKKRIDQLPRWRIDLTKHKENKDEKINIGNFTD